MQIQQLTYLTEVAKSGSLNKASKKLEVKQSSITRAIMQLEDELGCMLVYRNHKGIELTNEGKELVLYANQVLENYEKLKGIALSSGEKKYQKPLHITADVAFFLGKYIKTFHKKHEGIQVYLKEGSREQVIRDMIDGVCEMGLLPLTNWEEKVWHPIFKEQQLIFHKIRRSKVYAYVGDKHPLYNEAVIRPEQLKGFTLICLEGRPELSIDLNMNGDFKHSFIKEKIMYLGDKQTIVEVIKQTDAYALAAWCDYVPSEGIGVIPVNIEGLYYEIGWLEKRSQKKLTYEQETFIESFEAYIRDRGDHT